MPKEMDLIKDGTIRSYAKDVLDIRISTTAVDNVRTRFNDIIKTVMREAMNTAKKEDRSTIMPRDIDEQLEANLGKKNLSIDDIVDQIKRLNAIEIGALVKSVNQYIQEEKEKKNK